MGPPARALGVSRVRRWVLAAVGVMLAVLALRIAHVVLYPSLSSNPGSGHPLQPLWLIIWLLAALLALVAVIIVVVALAQAAGRARARRRRRLDQPR